MSVGNRRMKKFVKREWKIDGTEQQMKNVTVEFECVSLGREKRQTVSRIKFFYLREKSFVIKNLLKVASMFLSETKLKTANMISPNTYYQ